MTGSSRSPKEVEEHIAFRKSLAALNRTGKPDDIANAVLFPVSDEASFITVQTLYVDGGRGDRM